MEKASSPKGHSVNFKLDCKPKELLQEIFELGLSVVFPNITSTLRIFCQFACVNGFS
jgi:hypothetical protein